MVRHIPHRDRVPPAQPPPGQAAQFAVVRGFFQFVQQVRLSVLHFGQESEPRQAGSNRLHVFRLDLQPFGVGVDAVGAPHGRPAHAVAAVAPLLEHFGGSRHRLSQVDHQRLRAGLVHVVAQLQDHLSGPQRVQQAFDAAVHPRLVRQSGVVLVIGAQGVPVLEEAAGSLAVAGINHAVGALQHLFPLGKSLKGSSLSGLCENLFPVALQQLLHGRVAFLHRDFGVRFRPGKKQVS